MVRGPSRTTIPRRAKRATGTAGFPRYNLYNDIQVTSWDGLLANYSINYAFGAYLARNYGGAGLYGAIVQSDRSGVDAIEGALRELGHDASFADLLANWAAATLLSDSTAAALPYRYKCRHLEHLAERQRRDLPPGLDQPVQLRVRAAAGAGQAGLRRALPVLTARVQRA